VVKEGDSMTNEILREEKVRALENSILDVVEKHPGIVGEVLENRVVNSVGTHFDPIKPKEYNLALYNLVNNGRLNVNETDAEAWRDYPIAPNRYYIA